MIEKVLLARPRNGLVNEESCRATYCHDIRGRFAVTAFSESKSLLTFNFNHYWRDFIAGDYDLFLMVHPDVEPLGDDWMARLRDGLSDKYDVIHAPCMIKNQSGITSTALGKRVMQWGPLRRLHQNELQRLPEVFDFESTVAVLGRGDPWNGDWDCLLPNTGCMMVRRTMAAIKFPGFRQHDRILGVEGYDMRDGKPRVIGNLLVATESEDWNFGRWCARNGVKVAGHRGVITKHHGMAWFSTGDDKWLDTTDVYALAPSNAPRKVEGIETLI
jgi:hypothetical protein